jgi:hypothetical protein
MIVPDLLLRLRATYASASAYRDRGRVTVSGHEGALLSGAFTTNFRREAYLDYEFVPNVGTPIALCARAGAPVGLTGLNVPVTTLASAIAALTGVTALSAYVVPQLLLSNEVYGPKLWSGALVLERCQHRAVEASQCVEITFDDGTEVLLRERDAALLRFARTWIERGPEGKRTCVITYEPELGGDQGHDAPKVEVPGGAATPRGAKEPVGAK